MLDSRPLIHEIEDPLVIFDSDSLELALSEGDDSARLLLSYHSQREFRFARSPFQTSFQDLNAVPEFRLERRQTGYSTIGFEWSGGRSLKSMVHFDEAHLKHCARLLFGLELHEQLDEQERRTAELPILASQLNDHKTNCLLVTENATLLANRMKLQSQFGLRNLVMIDVEESREILDVWSKSRGRYLYAPVCQCNSGYWYWMSLRSKLRYYNVGDDNGDALAARYEYVLMAVDELTKQYYSGPTSDSMTMQVYHFNYLVSLVVGVFDSIALCAKDRLAIAFDGDDIPARTSLSGRSGKEFLKALRHQNPELRKHISAYCQFINGMYYLRENIVHKTMHPKVTFEMRGRDGNWIMNMIEVDKTVHDIFAGIPSRNIEHDVVSAWGAYRQVGEYYIEPSRFSRSCARHLEGFINECLRLLGFEDYLNAEGRSESHKRFVLELNSFKKNALAT